MDSNLCVDVDSSHICTPLGSPLSSTFDQTYSQFGVQFDFNADIKESDVDVLLWDQFYQDQNNEIKEDEFMYSQSFMELLPFPSILLPLCKTESKESEYTCKKEDDELVTQSNQIFPVFSKEEQIRINKMIIHKPRLTKKTRHVVDMREYLHLPQKEVASMLGIPSSTLHKRWKKSTDKKWPYRFISKLQIKIKTLEENYSVSKSIEFKSLIEKNRLNLKNEIGVNPIWIKTSVVDEGIKPEIQIQTHDQL